MRRSLLLLLLLVSSALSGCIIGRIVNYTTVPLTVNLHHTQMGSRTGMSDVKDFNYSYIRVRWSSNGIANIAAENGLEEVFFADLETLSILGIWTQEWVHIYGR
jgi:hypothetical protein